MSRAAPLFAAFAALCCGRPRVTVNLRVSEPYRGEGRRFAVHLLFPEDQVPYGCNELAYADLLPGTVESTTDQVKPLDVRSELSLDDIDRKARKVLWIEGFDGEGVRLVSGCLDLADEITQDRTETVIAEPTLEIVRVADAALSLALGQTKSLTVEVVDALGRRPSGGRARARVVTAAGIEAKGETTFQGGELHLNVPVLNRPGPFLLDLRVPWSRADPSIVPGTVVRPPVEIPLLLPAREFRAGRIGPSALPGVAALVVDASERASSVALFVRDRFVRRKLVAAFQRSLSARARS